MQFNELDYGKYSRMPSAKLDHIPGDCGLPVIGHTLPFLKDFHGLVQRSYKRYGSIYRSNAFFQNVVVALGPEANEAVLNDTEKCFSNSLAWNPTLDKLFPNGLMLKDFDDHRLHRKILQSAFKKQAVENYLGSMGANISANIGNWPRDKDILFLPAIKTLLLDVAAQAFMGLDLGPQADKINKSFVDATSATLAVIKIPIPGNKWSRGLKGRYRLETFVKSHIESKRDSSDTDFFAQICRAVDEEGNRLADQTIVDHLIFLLFAAHDTTTSTLCSVVYALAKHPEWQEELRGEFAQFDTKEWRYEDLAQMEKASLVFREALRMHPPLATIPRRCLRETDILGYSIPENAAVGISPLFTHYMQEYWHNPEQFDPQRFSSERAEHKQHFYQFIPFGGGVHKCLGLNFAEIQVKLFLSLFLTRYDLSVAEDYSMQYSVVPLCMPTDRLPIRIRDRN